MIHRNIIALFVVLVFLMPHAGAQGMKVGIVDMNRVFAEYYKTKDAEQDVNDQKELAKKELQIAEEANLNFPGAVPLLEIDKNTHVLKEGLYAEMKILSRSSRTVGRPSLR